jgi:hypothetical protein
MNCKKKNNLSSRALSDAGFKMSSFSDFTFISEKIEKPWRFNYQSGNTVKVSVAKQQARK